MFDRWKSRRSQRGGDVRLHHGPSAQRLQTRSGYAALTPTDHRRGTNFEEARDGRWAAQALDENHCWCVHARMVGTAILQKQAMAFSLIGRLG